MLGGGGGGADLPFQRFFSHLEEIFLLEDRSHCKNDSEKNLL